MRRFAIGDVVSPESSPETLGVVVGFDEDGDLQVVVSRPSFETWYAVDVLPSMIGSERTH